MNFSVVYIVGGGVARLTLHHSVHPPDTVKAIVFDTIQFTCTKLTFYFCVVIRNIGTKEITELQILGSEDYVVSRWHISLEQQSKQDFVNYETFASAPGQSVGI
ncbi:hypothetical protein Plhal703r1_c01g0004871 [Plasmopara halstedii]